MRLGVLVYVILQDPVIKFEKAEEPWKIIGILFQAFKLFFVRLSCMTCVLVLNIVMMTQVLASSMCRRWLGQVVREL